MLIGCALYLFNSSRSLDVSIEPVTLAASDSPQVSELVAPTSSRAPDEAQAVAVEPTPLSGMKGAEALPQIEQASLWHAFSEARREIRPLTDHQRTMPGNEGADYLASNPSQKIRGRFLPDGVRLLSGYSSRDWEAVIGLGSNAVAEIRTEGTQLEYARPGIVEWYHNNRAGIEHGFIVEQRLVGSTTDTLVVPISVDGLSVAPLDGREADSSDLQFVNLEGEPVLSYTDLKVWDATGTPLLARMQPTAKGLQILVADSGAAYPITIDPLIASLEQKLGPEVTGDGAVGDYFGYSVSVSGDTALVGGFRDEGVDMLGGSAFDQGSVYIFRLSMIGADYDEDGASDAWGYDNGFSSYLSGDFLTLDTDQDGALDLLEIFQGTDKMSATSNYGLLTQSADGSTQSMKARFRRSTASTGVAATYHWSPNLTDWYIGGMDAEGIKVEFSESVVSSGPGYEIVALTATITLGSADELFIRIAVEPVE